MGSKKSLNPEEMFQSDEIKFWSDPIYKEKELETILKAEDTLLKQLQTQLPELQNVIIEPL